MGIASYFTLKKRLKKNLKIHLDAKNSCHGNRAEVSVIIVN